MSEVVGREGLVEVLAGVEVSEDHMLVSLGEPQYSFDENGSAQVADDILGSDWLAAHVAEAVAVERAEVEAENEKLRTEIVSLTSALTHAPAIARLADKANAIEARTTERDQARAETAALLAGIRALVESWSEPADPDAIVVRTHFDLGRKVGIDTGIDEILADLRALHPTLTTESDQT